MKKCFISVIAAGILFVSLIQLAGCDKKDGGFTSDAVTDYMQLQKGKYILYRLDSMRFTNFGQKRYCYIVSGKGYCRRSRYR